MRSHRVRLRPAEMNCVDHREILEQLRQGSRRALSRLLTIAESDPIAYVVSALLLFVAAVAASYLPARRAAGLAPLLILRNE